jgi:hypothetical protein
VGLHWNSEYPGLGLEAERQETGAGLDLLGDLISNSFDVRSTKELSGPALSIFNPILTFFQLQLGDILRVWTE